MPQTMKLKLIHLTALLPLLGSQIALAADPVPKFDAAPSCRSAGVVAVIGNRNTAACQKDEGDARATLEKEWSQFTPSDKARCTRLVTVGGSPSYVELLTCLEMAKGANELPAADEMDSGGPVKKSRRSK